MKRKHISIIFRFIFSGAIIIYFLFVLSSKYGGLGKGLSSFLSVFSKVSLVWIIPAFSLHFVGIALMSLRWRILLKAQVGDVRYCDLYSFNLMAAFFNNFLPSTIGGDIVKGLESKKFTGDKTTSLTVIFVERVTGMVALVVISLTALLIYSVKVDIHSGGSNPLIYVGIVMTVISGIVLISIPSVNERFLKVIRPVLPKRVFEIISKAFFAIKVYYRYPAALFKALAVSLMFQLNMVFYYFFISASIGQNPDIIDFMIKAPILIFLLMTLPSVNGIGVRTAVFGNLMKFSTPAALAVEALDIALRMILGVFGGIVYLFYKRDKNILEQDRSSIKTIDE